MANATTTTPGSVIIAGDLTGTATSPALRPTGVTAGAHFPWYFWVDSKGRILKTSSDITWNTLEPFIDVGSTGTKGIVQVGTNISVTSGSISVATATTSVKGVVQIGSGFNVVDGTISVPDATDASKGIVQVGTGLDVASGVISLGTATNTVLGGVKVGTSLQINTGVLDVGSTYIKTDVANTFTKSQNAALSTRNSVTGNVDVDISTYGDVQLWNLTGNTTVTNSSDALLVPGSVFNIIVKQDATGSRTISFGTNYLLGSGITLSTAPNTYDMLTFIVIDSTNIIVLFNPDWT